jgi:hypothetical protein
MSPAIRTIAVTIGFAVGFLLLLDGGASLAVLLLSLARAELPSLGLLAATFAYLAIPLLAFHRYDLRRRSARQRSADSLAPTRP